MIHNGTNNLLNLFSSEEDFIKHFIQSCFFFSRDSVKQRNEEIFEYIKNQKELPIRFSFRSEKKRKEFTCDGFYLRGKSKGDLEKLLKEGKKLIFKGNDDNILVNIDSTGNQNVTKAIFDHTGYLVNQSESHFIGYTISHIWENTTHNPLFFSSLWNIAIIPNYLNYIMDKPKTQDTINEKIQETIKAISIFLYSPEELMKNKFSLSPIKDEYKKLAQKAISENWVKFLDNNEEEEIVNFEGIIEEETIQNSSRKGKNKEIVFEALNLLYDNGFKEYLYLLEDKEFCKRELESYYPILVKGKNKVDSKRYYSSLFIIEKGDKNEKKEEFYVSNDWFDGNKKEKINKRINLEIFLAWVNDILNKN